MGLLFDSDKRNWTAPRPTSMPIYEFLNRSNNPDVLKICAEWEVKFNLMPIQVKNDVGARFRSQDDREHYSALLEIFLYSFFQNMNFNIELHKCGTNKSHADFYITKEAGSPCYVEAQCIFGRDYELESQERRQIYDALRTIKTDKFMLEVTMSGLPTGTPRIKGLIKSVETWLNKIDNAVITKFLVDGNYSSLPTLSLSSNGIDLKFVPIPLKKHKSRKQNISVIYSPNAIAIRSDAHERLRDRLQKKAKRRYGSEQSEIFLVANVFDFFFDEDDIFDALFGDRVIYFSRKAGSMLTSDENLPPRRNNGFWRVLNYKLTNERISGVVVFDRLDAGNFSTNRPKLIYNPYIEQEYVFKQFPQFDQFIPDLENGSFARFEG